MRVILTCVAVLLVSGVASGQAIDRGAIGNILPLPEFVNDEGRGYFGTFYGTHRPQMGGAQYISLRLARDGYARLVIQGDGLQPAQRFRGAIGRDGRFHFVDLTDHRRSFSGRIDKGRLSGSINRAGQRQGAIRAEHRLWRLERRGFAQRLQY